MEMPPTGGTASPEAKQHVLKGFVIEAWKAKNEKGIYLGDQKAKMSAKGQATDSHRSLLHK